MNRKLEAHIRHQARHVCSIATVQCLRKETQLLERVANNMRHKLLHLQWLFSTRLTVPCPPLSEVSRHPIRCMLCSYGLHKITSLKVGCSISTGRCWLLLPLFVPLDIEVTSNSLPAPSKSFLLLPRVQLVLLMLLVLVLLLDDSAWA